MEKSSLVLELQRLAQDGNTGLPELLRRAKVVASKLDLEDARTWIDYEIGGYPLDLDKIPPYRIIPCTLKAWNPLSQHWMPCVWEPGEPMHEPFSQAPMGQPIVEIEAFAKKKNPHSPLNQFERSTLYKLGNHDILTRQFARFYSPDSFICILEYVRDKILTWSLALEKQGVLGEGMTFKDTEKRDAARVTLNIENVATLVHGDHANTQTATHSSSASLVQTSFSAEQVAAQGTNATATGNVMTQELTLASTDQRRALKELATLRKKLGSSVKNSADAIELGKVGLLEEAARRGDSPAVTEALRNLAPKTQKEIDKLGLTWLRARR